jgi:hypothetical protein
MPSIFEPEPTMEHQLEPADDAALEREFGEAGPVERADATLVSGAGWPDRTTGDTDTDTDADEGQAVQDTGEAAVSSEPGDVETPVAGAVAVEPVADTATPDAVQTHRLGPDIRSFPAPPLAGPDATPTPTPTVPDEAAQAAAPADGEPAEAFADAGTPGGEERIDVESPVADLGDAGLPATEPPDVTDVSDATGAVEEPEAVEEPVGAAAAIEAEPAASIEPAEAGAVGAGVGAPASSPADRNTAALADAASAAANMASNPYRPQWDAARHAYICWEPVSSQWLQWDDAGEVWGPISQ